MYDYSPTGLDLELAKSARKTPQIELPKQQSSALELIISGDLPGPASPAWDRAIVILYFPIRLQSSFQFALGLT